MKTCSIEDCDRPVKGRGWCAKHYKLWQLHGTPHTNRKPGGQPGAQPTLRHGHWSNGKPSKTYATWNAMKQRVLNPNRPNYRLYGGRGITIHQPWIDSFEAFLADVGERPEGTSIDRIDPDGNYEPGNVRWATPSEQALNRRPRVTA